MCKTKWINSHTYDKVTVDLSTGEHYRLLSYVFRFKIWCQMVQDGVDVNTWSMFKGFVVHMFRHLDIHFIFFRHGVFNQEVFQRNTFVDISDTGHWFARYWISFIIGILPNTAEIEHDIEMMKCMFIKWGHSLFFLSLSEWFTCLTVFVY